MSDLHWQSMPYSDEDRAFDEQARKNREAIVQAQGIPPSMVGVPSPSPTREQIMQTFKQMLLDVVMRQCDNVVIRQCEREEEQL